VRSGFSIAAVSGLAVLALLLFPDGPSWRGALGCLVIVLASVEVLRVLMLWSRSGRRVAHLMLALAAVAGGVALAASWRVYLAAAFIIIALLIHRQLLDASEADG
jgi:hypothetical protein